MPRDLFTSSELQQIQAAVKQAEASSGGEIVPVLARQSSFYETAFWRAGFVFSFLAGVILSTLYLTTEYVLFLPPYLWLLFVLTAGLLGALFAQLAPPWKRLLISEALQKARVLDQAKDMFYDYGLSYTEQRTGILIYISFFEHQAVVLADRGIDELVLPPAWELIIEQLTDRLKKGQRVAGICETIVSCGKLLEESGVQKAVDDDNELPDDIRFNE